MDLTGLKAVQAQLKDQKAQQSKEANQDSKNQIANLDLQETIVKTAKMVVDYMDGKITKTAVINQIEGFATSEDSEKVTSALESLHETLKKHENVDITPLTEVMNNVLKEAKAIPKTQKEVKIPTPKDYSKEFTKLSKLVSDVESAIKAQETTVEAPVVNLPETVVNVEKPDLKPLTKDLKAIEGAIKKIVIPAQIHTDTSKIEKELKASNKLLKEIRDTPGGGGGGGGTGSIAPFMVNGALPVSDTASPGYTLYDANDSAPIYIGTNNDSDALTSASDWTIYKHTYSGANVTAIRKKIGVWDDRASIF